MRRRDLLALLGGVAAAWSGVAVGQPATRPRRIGFLRASPPPENVLDAFKRGLAERGYIEGRNYVVVRSWGDGTLDRLPALATELVKAEVDIVVADGTRPASAARKASTTIPVVMAGGLDPVLDGLAESLSRPGGNVTGFTTQVIELVGKSFQILREVMSELKRIAIFAPRGVGVPFRRADVAAAKELDLAIDYIDMAGAQGADAAMGRAVAAGAQCGVMRGTPFLSTAQRRMIVERAAADRLPMMYETRDFVDLGGLISYGSDFDELFRLAADYVVKILQGADPANLPIQQSTRIELVVNLKAAKALGLAIPGSILSRADEVIE